MNQCFSTKSSRLIEKSPPSPYTASSSPNETISKLDQFRKDLRQQIVNQINTKTKIFEKRSRPRSPPSSSSPSTSTFLTFNESTPNLNTYIKNTKLSIDPRNPLNNDLKTAFSIDSRSALSSVDNHSRSLFNNDPRNIFNNNPKSLFDNGPKGIFNSDPRVVLGSDIGSITPIDIYNSKKRSDINSNTSLGKRSSPDKILNISGSAKTKSNMAELYEVVTKRKDSSGNVIRPRENNPMPRDKLTLDSPLKDVEGKKAELNERMQRKMFGLTGLKSPKQVLIEDLNKILATKDKASSSDRNANLRPEIKVLISKDFGSSRSNLAENGNSSSPAFKIDKDTTATSNSSYKKYEEGFKKLYTNTSSVNFFDKDKPLDFSMKISNGYQINDRKSYRNDDEIAKSKVLMDKIPLSKIYEFEDLIGDLGKDGFNNLPME